MIVALKMFKGMYRPRRSNDCDKISISSRIKNKWIGKGQYGIKY